MAAGQQSSGQAPPLSVYSVSIGSGSGEEVQLAVHECSPAEGYRKTPVLCLPGLWCTARSFDDLICRLASSSGRRVLALSMRGHGGSSKSDGSLYTVSEAAYDVSAALRVLALESTVLLGHGVGAMIATRVAMLEPERVAGLILCSGVRKLKTTANWGGEHRSTCTLDALIKRIAPSKADETDPCAADEALWRAAAELTSAREETAASAAGSPSLEDVRRSAPSALRSMLCSSLVSEVTPEGLAAFTGRTLLLWGTDDVFSTLTEQLELLRLLKPRAELKQIDGGGHSLLWEAKRAGLVCEALTEFVLSLEEGAATGLRRSKSTTAALQAYGDAVGRALLKVESQPHEAPEQTLRHLLTAAAGSLLPPPPPPNKGNKSISQARAIARSSPNCSPALLFLTLLRLPGSVLPTHSSPC
jgi:pimeloyl-ACP methyl ester carboxylesterase